MTQESTLSSEVVNQVLNHFFEDIEGDVNSKKCKRCKKPCKQKATAGHGNLFAHLRSKGHSKEYEDLIVRAKAKALVPFLRAAVVVVDEEELTAVEAAEREVQLLMQQGQKPSAYVCLKFIPATSAMVERFSSQTKLIQTPHRRATLPITFEEIAFLKMNAQFWDVTSMAVVEKEVEEELI